MPDSEPVRLLIVDDETAQMRALCDTLSQQGYVAVGCHGSEAALLALREAPFHLLLTDLMMPGLSGIELLRAALLIDPSLVGIIMTGAGTIDSAVEAMQSGALDYILKPFKLSAILPVLARALAVRRLRLENESLAQQLREHAAQLEHANAELDAFTRSASHDLRTPLNAVIGFSGLLNAKYGPQLPSDAVGWLKQIEQAGTRMNQLIDDLLRLSRLGRQAIELTEVDLMTLVTQVVLELNQAQAQPHAAFSLGELPWVQGDASLLHQVFTNLLSNAFKFTRNTQQARVEVACELQQGEPVFIVRDNGAGFDMAQAGRLFGAFERLHSAQEFEGTGIGLSIVQRIISRHGGRIWADSQPNRGTTFSFTLGC